MDPIFDEAGSANAPVLVLVHGSVVTRKMWLPQLSGLSDTYRILAPDLPGHGSLAHIPFTFAAAVQMLAELIDREARGCALVAGLSLGGYIAIELAAAHPDRVSGLVLSGCSFNFTGALGLYLKSVSRLMLLGWLKQSRATAEEKTRRMFPPELADVAESQLRAGVYPESLGPAFAEMAGRDFTIPLAKYRGPGLILNGERDAASRRGKRNSWRRWVRGGRRLYRMRATLAISTNPRPIIRPYGLLDRVLAGTFDIGDLFSWRWYDRPVFCSDIPPIDCRSVTIGQRSNFRFPTSFRLFESIR